MSSTTPTLNFDMISKILNIRMNEKKNDRYKNMFDSVLSKLNDINGENPYSSCDDKRMCRTTRQYTNQISGLVGPEVVMDLNTEFIFESIQEFNETHQRPYMPWEVQGSGY